MSTKYQRFTSDDGSGRPWRSATLVWVSPMRCGMLTLIQIVYGSNTTFFPRQPRALSEARMA